MADQKISELTALTGANVADDDAIAIVDTSATETKKIVFSELKNALDSATGFVRITGDTMTGNLSMGDNVKAIFGAGSDLQIYHDGANSYISDQGEGNIYLRSDNGLVVQNAAGTETVAVFAKDDACELFYDNSKKLNTTSTGIDVTGTVTADGLTVDTNTLHVDATNNRVGIGTSSPNGTLTVRNDSTNTEQLILGNSLNTGGRDWRLGRDNAASGDFIIKYSDATNNNVTTEAMRIDSSGNVLVGKTATNYQTVGVEAKGNGSLWATADGNGPLVVTRKTSDGTLADFYKNTTKVGSIGKSSEGVYFVNSTQVGILCDSTSRVVPCNSSGGLLDNIADLGRSTARWDDIYATNGTIQTSDRNEKQQIAALTDAEITAAKAISALFKTYKWNKQSF